MASSHTIGIVGIRDHKGSLYENKTYVVRTLESHLRMKGHDFQQINVIIGGGRGVEQMVVEWCEAKDITYRKIPPNIQEFGARKAFTVRNNHIVSKSDELIVFWDGCIDIITDSIITAMHQSKQATVYPVI